MFDEFEKDYEVCNCIKVTINDIEHAVLNDGVKSLRDLQERAISNQNIFEALMEVCKVCSLGQITSALFEVGGQYRRNM